MDMVDLLSPVWGDLNADLITPHTAFGLAHAVYTHNSEWATALSGTTDKKSSTYKAALRRVQRWTTSGKERRTPSVGAQQQLAEVLREDERAIDVALDQRGEIELDVEGAVTTSQDTRERRVAITLSADEAKAVSAAIRAGETAHAYELIWTAYGHIPDRVVKAQVRIKRP